MTSEADANSATRRLQLVPEFPADLRAALVAGDRALYSDGDLRASREDFERAYQLAELAGDAQAMARAALGLAGLWVSERRTVTGAAMLQTRLQRCLGLLDPGSSLALRLRVRLAGESDYVRGGRDEILAALGEARAAADSVALAEALSLAHHCLLGPDGARIRRALAVELIQASFSTDRRSDRLMGLLWQTVDAYFDGDPHAGRLLGELRELLGPRGHPAVGFVLSAIDVMLAIRAGNLTEAESLIRTCADSGELAGDIDSEWWPGAQLVTIRWYQGRLAELLPMLSERVHSPALSAIDDSVVAALSVAAALSGDSRTAVSCLARLRGSNLASLPRSSSWLVTMNGVAEAASLVADADLAAAAYDLLVPYARLPMIGGLGATCFGSTQHALGVASLTVGQPDRAVGHFQTAIQLNLALPHWPAVVASRLRLADALTLRGQPGDLEAAGQERLAAAGEAVATGGDSQPSMTVTAADAARALCSRVGRNWRVTLQGRSVLLPDSIGMMHLAVLISNPRQDIPAAELVAGLSALTVSGGDAGAGQPVLDRQAIAEYRDRLARLDTEIARLVTDGAEQQAAPAQAERGWLAAQLTSAAGLSGRTRTFAGDAERARVAAGKAIRRALGRITAADPVIGEHLQQTVRTGTRCSYWPD